MDVRVPLSVQQQIDINLQAVQRLVPNRKYYGVHPTCPTRERPIVYQYFGWWVAVSLRQLGFCFTVNLCTFLLKVMAQMSWCMPALGCLENHWWTSTLIHSFAGFSLVLSYGKEKKSIINLKFSKNHMVAWHRIARVHTTTTFNGFNKMHKSSKRLCDWQRSKQWSYCYCCGFPIYGMRTDW